jgi:excisionase family DNA binding protein
MRTYLTTGNIARLFRVSSRTAAKWCDEGRLRCHRLPISKTRRVTVTEVRRFAAEYKLPFDEKLLDAMTGYAVTLPPSTTAPPGSVPSPSSAY